MSATSLQIGKNALLAQTAALDVAGQNLSNSATEGYSRQSISTSATTAKKNSSYYSGTGVEVDSVSRIIDSFYKEEVRTCTGASAYADELNNIYSALENNFNELTETDISTELNNVWSALNDLSLDPDNTELAIIAVQKADSLAGTINSIDEGLVEIQDELNSKIETDVDSINSLTQQIAEMNKSIMSAEACGSNGLNANDLRDERDRLVKELSAVCDVKIYEESNGSYTIYNNNNIMVYRDSSEEVGIKYENLDGVRYSQPVFSDGNVAIESESGSLGAALYLRDGVVTTYQDDLDELAANIIWEFNSVYSQGVGNIGYSEIVGCTAVEDTAVALDQLDYGVDAIDGTYEVTNGSFEMLIYNTETETESTVVISIDIDNSLGSIDTILYDMSDPEAENSLVNIMQKQLDEEIPGAYSVSINNNNQLIVESNSEIYKLGFGSDTSGAVSALGLNNLFTGFNAGDISVNELLEDEPEHFSTGSSFTESNNDTVNNLIALRSENVLSGKTQTIEGYYCSMAGTLGVEAENAAAEQELRADLLLLSKNNNESVSGVSTDEELVNLLNYQRAYQAAAEFITVIDECMQTILDM